MKRITIALLLILGCVAAQAGVIVDIQTGLVPEDTHVVVENAVVTGVLYNGFFIGETLPGPYTGIWVYDGGANIVAKGDIVTVAGMYEEYWGLSEINVTTDPEGVVTNLGSGGCCNALNVTIAELNAAIAADNDAYESVWINVVDGMIVTGAPSSYGIWDVESYDTPGEFLLMDDYWYDDATVVVGDCYFCATGIYVWNFDQWKLDPFEDGVSIVDCSVANETMTFGDVKCLYR